MRQGLLILLGLLAVTWFEFKVYPGHSYLQGETQLLVPMLERLDTPAFLSRDLVAANPALSFTIYDELEGLLHADAHVPFETALQCQQILFRFAGVIGVFLLARALKVGPYASLAISAVINAVTFLSATHSYITNPEPTPTAFALPLVLLASGLFAHRGVLLAGFFGGLALLYDPVTAGAFWYAVALTWIFDRSLRKLLNPALLAFVIFVLILANLVQLQSGLGDSNALFSRISPTAAQLTRLRTPWVWICTWVLPGIWNYAFLLVAGVWAFARVAKGTRLMGAWVLFGLASSGIVAMILTSILLNRRLGFATAMSPLRDLSFTVIASLLACGAAAYHTIRKRSWGEGVPFTLLLIAALLNPQVLDLLHLKIDGIARPQRTSPDLAALADWADTTWGSSMFQFPDAGKDNDPGVFRALSRRALWADWESGLIADYSESAGQQWWSRWHANMESSFSLERLGIMLPQPIDYYVLLKRHQLANVKPVYANSTYLVYDAQDLREARAPLAFRRPD